jgi:RNA polymerase sigma factor (sigma-70 family)
VLEGIFESSYDVAVRMASVRAARAARSLGLPSDYREDLKQDVLLELWRRRSAYNPQRGSWRTFSEHVSANRITSAMRSMYSERSGHFRESRLENFRTLVAPEHQLDLRIDLEKVLAGVSQFDRKVARYLIGHSATETSRRLQVSRATIHRAVVRLRAAFTAAGLSPRGPEYGPGRKQSRVIQ